MRLLIANVSLAVLCLGCFLPTFIEAQRSCQMSLSMPFHAMRYIIASQTTTKPPRTKPSKKSTRRRQRKTRRPMDRYFGTMG
uniref:Putative secreted protein n=1 Tax=Psorophora albipes TaxID=869069 RepID=T1E2U6_9DIPT